MLQTILPCRPQGCQVLLASQEMPPNMRLAAEFDLVRAIIACAGGEAKGEDATFGSEGVPRSGLVILMAENICFISVNPTLRSC